MIKDINRHTKNFLYLVGLGHVYTPASGGGTCCIKACLRPFSMKNASEVTKYSERVLEEEYPEAKKIIDSFEGMSAYGSIYDYKNDKIIITIVFENDHKIPESVNTLNGVNFNYQEDNRTEVAEFKVFNSLEDYSKLTYSVFSLTFFEKLAAWLELISN